MNNLYQMSLDDPYYKSLQMAIDYLDEHLDYDLPTLITVQSQSNLGWLDMLYRDHITVENGLVYLRDPSFMNHKYNYEMHVHPIVTTYNGVAIYHRSYKIVLEHSLITEVMSQYDITALEGEKRNLPQSNRHLEILATTPWRFHDGGVLIKDKNSAMKWDMSS